MIFLCYDTTNQTSFDDLEDWLDVVQKHNKKAQAHVFLIGNKKDLEHRQEVTQDAHDRLVAIQQLSGGFLVSAQSGESVLRSFTKAAALSVNLKVSEHELALTDKVRMKLVYRNEGKA